MHELFNALNMEVKNINLHSFLLDVIDIKKVLMQNTKNNIVNNDGLTDVHIDTKPLRYFYKYLNLWFHRRNKETYIGFK